MRAISEESSRVPMIGSSAEQAWLDRTLAVLGWLAAVVVAGMVVGIVTTHSSQEYFQSARVTEDFQQHLATNQTSAFGLRLNLALDNLFIVVYVAFFTFLAVRVRGLIHDWILGVALGAILVTGLLDAIENHHIMLMLHSIENHLPLSIEGSQIQMIGSNLKFHASYLGCFLFAFGYGKLGGLGKIIAWVLWLGYLPFGFVLAVWPVNSAPSLALIRTGFFVVAFILSGLLFLRLAMPAKKVISGSTVTGRG